ncbi:vanadium-dependent haloperoxidase [Salsipaludibacter albus]|uniref:vanadium-dependent haloperoxidase n=1 Tax=Salsipaludibacter albus TaxID=2849650 RepID=UPI001EE3A783|nr:vanadium-dependent haloperoxidase [Salsipaludibacter albus]MBY5162568.1 vanadium-dependent haloperoxidase [Salsipaludibacter albus]
MRRPSLSLVTGATLLALVLSILPAGLVSASADTPVDPVVTWNRHATDALMVRGGQPPQQSVVHLAMVHGAVEDAVGSAGRLGPGVTADARRAALDAAVATAAHDTLVAIVPGQQVILDQVLTDALAAIPDGPAEDRGSAAGHASAAAMVAARADDGRFGPYRFPTATDIGAWRPVPPSMGNDPNAWLKDVRPFTIRDAAQFGGHAPLPLSSPRYAREFREVLRVGSADSAIRTADQTEAARYWAENPPATWARIMRTIATDQELSTRESAELFATSWSSAADALITVWAEKARWSFWRPITAIAEAADDGNPATDPAVGWTALIPTPPYPEHPSGHGGLSGALVTSMQVFFGSDRVAWTDTNGAGLTRSFTRLSDALDEVVDARVWSGIHFRTADEDGARIGRDVAAFTARHDRHHHDPGRGATHGSE